MTGKMMFQPMFYEEFSARVQPMLGAIYHPDIAHTVTKKLFQQLQGQLQGAAGDLSQKWSADDVILITYGDSLQQAQQPIPLRSLEDFLQRYLQETITGVHILPFFPFSSDDGFAVIDYRVVNPALGNWSDIQRIADQFDLMVDLVMNHVSAQSAWFQQFQQGQPPGKDYFIEVAADAPLSEVVRPRSSPILRPVETVAGTQYVWATFSHDQVDLNFANPEVLVEFIDILLFYMEQGAKYIRLDAIAYLWKRLGTRCIHLPETHTIVKLMREILQMVDPSVILITETNVPNRENLSYFGNRNEAHIIYNFSLPPLLLNALLQGKSEHLQHWLMSLPPAPQGCAYLNFTASHDGIGLRPTEGLLSQDEYDSLLQCIQNFGGRISLQRNSDGSESPYEANISYFDACKGTVQGEDQWQIQRFLCSQTVMMSLEGIPAFYIHSLVATPNDQAGVDRTGQNRSINRHQLDYDLLEQQLADPTSARAIVFQELRRLIRLRRQQPAFHPNATQYILHLNNPALFAFWRQSLKRDQSLFSLHNLSDQPQRVHLFDLNLTTDQPWCDIISQTCLDDLHGSFILAPYTSAWITNAFEPNTFMGQACHLESC